MGEVPSECEAERVSALISITTTKKILDDVAVIEDFSITFSFARLAEFRHLPDEVGADDGLDNHHDDEERLELALLGWQAPHEHELHDVEHERDAEDDENDEQYEVCLLRRKYHDDSLPDL